MRRKIFKILNKYFGKGSLVLTLLFIIFLTFHEDFYFKISCKLHILRSSFQYLHPEWWRTEVCQDQKVFNITDKFIELESMEKLLKNIEDVRNSTPVFLSETFCQTSMNFRHLCSVESFAFHNPDSQIYLFFLLPMVDDKHGFFTTLQNTYKNLNFLTLDKLDKIFLNTPSQELFQNKCWTLNPDMMPANLNDFIRLALIWQFGGTYVDTDVICLKHLSSLQNNIGFESEAVLNFAFFNFQPRHSFLFETMRLQSEIYNPFLLRRNGPGTVTASIENYCSLKTIKELRRSKEMWCHDIQLLDERAFHPISYDGGSQFFQKANIHFYNKIFEKSYAVHYYSSLTSKWKLKLNDFNLLNIIASENCPVLYKGLTEKGIEYF